jgi:hypothetical protein
MTITIAIAVAALLISFGGFGLTVVLRAVAMLKSCFDALHEIGRLSEAMDKLSAAIERIGTQQGEFLERMHKHEVEIARLNEQVNDLTPIPRRKATG